MRILILSANTGGGHNATARALAEQMEKVNTEYEIVDTLAFISEKVSDFISWGHSYVYRRFPNLFGFGYRFEEKHPPRFIYDQCARGADALAEKLKSAVYDAIICVHVFSGMMVTEVKKREGLRIPCFFVATDYTCSPGVSDLLMDGYFIPHRMLLGEFVRGGLPADRLFPVGIPVRSAFYEEISKEEARKRLGIPADGQLILLSCGSMGCGHLDKAALYLYKNLPFDARLVVLCGNNKKVYETLKPSAGERFIVLDFTDKVPLLVAAADIYITKPGGLATTEAIAKRTPMIFIDAVPGCETRNYDFLTRQGVASGARNWRQVNSQAQKALRDPRILNRQKEKMKDFSSGNAAEQICRIVRS